MQDLISKSNLLKALSDYTQLLGWSKENIEKSRIYRIIEKMPESDPWCYDLDKAPEYVPIIVTDLETVHGCIKHGNAFEIYIIGDTCVYELQRIKIKAWMPIPELKKGNN